eukprot:SAG22_NODE_9317_length_596_cov_2.024145_1_plen_86_part_00
MQSAALAIGISAKAAPAAPEVTAVNVVLTGPSAAAAVLEAVPRALTAAGIDALSPGVAHADGYASFEVATDHHKAAIAAAFEAVF